MTRLLLAALALAAAPAFGAPPVTSPVGTWTNPKHSVTLRIAACGGGAWCGRVTAASAKAKADALAGSGQPLIGTMRMQSFRPAGAGGWKGSLIIPDIRQAAEATMRMAGRNAIEIKGCAMGGLVCKTQLWTRVAGKRR